MMSMLSSIQPSEAETSAFLCPAVMDLYHDTRLCLLITGRGVSSEKSVED
jgi:hypothetical protein